MSVASLILGIMGLVVSIFGGDLAIFGIILGIPAIVLGALARTAPGHKTMPTIGLVLGCIALPISFIVWRACGAIKEGSEKFNESCNNKKIERSYNFDFGTPNNNNSDKDDDSENENSEAQKHFEDKMDKLGDAIEDKLNNMFFEN